MAIMKGKSRIVEHLVGYGADMNAVDNDEDTPLHLVLNAVDNDEDSPLHLLLGRDEVTMDAPSSETPELMKVNFYKNPRIDHATKVIATFAKTL